MFLGMDMNYILMVMLPGMILSGLASFFVKSTFNKYSQTRSRSGMTGAEAARYMLDRNGLQNVGIERVQGFLSDHYDPRHRVLRLSPAVHDAPSFAAIGVACHEAGHALQHAKLYGPLKLRSLLVPAANIGNKFGMWIIMAGLFMGTASNQAGGGLGQTLLLVGVGLFSLAVLFTLVTLPVEWDASARAKKAIAQYNILSPQEQPHAGKVLNAAFLTYLASAISSVLTLLYFLMRAGLLGRRD